jgi:hypothetical protein
MKKYFTNANAYLRFNEEDKSILTVTLSESDMLTNYSMVYSQTDTGYLVMLDKMQQSVNTPNQFPGQPVFAESDEATFEDIRAKVLAKIAGM